LGHARQRPQIRIEAVRASALAQSLIHLPQLPRFQFGFTSRPASTSQSRGPAASPFPVPPRHTLTTDLEFAGNGCMDHFAGRKQAGRLFTSAF